MLRLSVVMGRFFYEPVLVLLNVGVRPVGVLESVYVRYAKSTPLNQFIESFKLQPMKYRCTGLD